MSNTSGLSFGLGNNTIPNTTTNDNTSNIQASGFGESSIPRLNFNVSTSTPVVTTVGQPSFGLSFSSANAAKSTSFNFSTPSSTNTISTAKSNIVSTLSPITSTTGIITSSITSQSVGKSINYLQLQDLNNKWIADFDDLQKTLMNQTAETVNRDVILASNQTKIEKLVNSIQSLKIEQIQVEQQLDFIVSQQRDLEECLVSLEEEVSSYFPELPADDMYKLAENIDSRLKKTLETSKEIITKINDKNRSSENATNPMVAIGRILNHFTNSIQMLENLTAEGQAKLNDLVRTYQQYA